LNTPIGASWDEANDTLLVASTGQSLIKAFDAAGTFLWKSPTGTDLGAHAMRDVTRGPDGRIWLSAYKEHQMRAYDVTPAGVWTTTPAIVLPAAGDGDALNFPYNVEFSPDGNTAYVADTGKGRVARWDISGASPRRLTDFGRRCDVHPQPCPDPPASQGEFNHLRRVTLDGTGNVYAADFWGGGIEVFGPDGTVIEQIEGAVAPLPGFAEAFGVDQAADGTTYVMDRLNHRIERFSPAGEFLNAAGARGTQPGTFAWPEALAVGPDGTVWAMDTRGDRLEKWPADLATTPNVPSYGSTGPALGQFNYSEGLDVAEDGRVFVADTRNNRIQIFDPATSTFTAFGTFGSGNGQFNDPRGVAVTSDAVYVADTLNNRVQKLSLTGAFQASYATGLNNPEGIAVAGDGTVWVADTLNNRVVHLAADLGSNLGDGFGSAGAGEIQFNQPHDLSVSGNKLYVADTYNDRVQFISTGDAPPPPPPLDLDPSFQRNIANAGGVAPLYPAGGAADGTGDRYVADSGGSRIVKINSTGGQSVVSATGWNDPRDLVLDVATPDSNALWVADTSNSRVVKISKTGTVLQTVTGLTQPYGLSNDDTKVYVANTYGNGVRAINKSGGTTAWTTTTCFGTAFSRPRDVGVGTDGNVYAADTDNDRIVVLSPAGACLRQFGTTGTGNAQFKSPRSVTSDGSGGIWVADAFNYRIQHLSNAGAFLGGTPAGAFGEANGQLRSPACVFRDGSLIAVCDTYNYRIARYTAPATGTPLFRSNVGGTRPAAGGFNGPFATAYGPAGELYVVDWFNQRIQKFNPDGSFALQFGGYGSKPGSLIFPRGILVAPGGQLVVTDSENNRIDLFTSAGAFVRSVKPTTGTPFSRPHQTALAADGSYWVADTNANRILHLSTTGAVLHSWNGGGTIVKPQGVAVGGDGNIYVSNTGRNVVDKYSPAGAKLATFAPTGSAAGQVRSPAGLLVTGTGSAQRLWVADAGNNRIQVFSTTGSVDARFGSVGQGAGQFSNPKAVALDPTDGQIAVADFGNNRVSIWSSTGGGTPPPGDTVAPDSVVTTPVDNETYPSPVAFAGTATDDVGVDSVGVAVKNPVDSTWLQRDGSWGPTRVFLAARLAASGSTSTGWSFTFTAPAAGRYGLTVKTDDAAGNTDPTKPWVTFKVA
jgi:DNA-binding beta-propeller fold protein YncE